jgi:5-methyltetrahydrofolate--homocysteine methyltransferase
VHDIGKNIVGVVLQCNGYDVVDLGVMVPAERILDAAREEGVDVVGLSGLITPSLDQMVHVASEMQRTGFEAPLLIGGATTSKAHTAVKIEQCYDGPTVHVLDASRAVGVVATLLDANRREEFVRTTRASYEAERARRAGREAKRDLLSLDEARIRRAPLDWTTYAPPAPARPGVYVVDDVTVSELRPYIDWTPFFQAWEVHGRYPDLLDDPTVGEHARTLLADAEEMLDRLDFEKVVSPRAVVGLFPAQSEGDDVLVFAPDASPEPAARPLATLFGLRQQFSKTRDRPSLALADYVAPLGSGVRDWIGAFAVTAGAGAERLAAELEARHDDYSAILVKALADRLAEALAELVHERTRTRYWGYASDEALASQALIREEYRGIRPAPGYPACPDHTEKGTLFRLLDVSGRIGIELTESYAMRPGASVSGWYFSHPEARYFGVGRIGRDQVEAYAARKGWTVEEAERWLAPNLGYAPRSPS